MVYEALERDEGSGDAGSAENQPQPEAQKRTLTDEELDNLLIRYKADGEEHEGTAKEARDRLAQGKHLDGLMQQLGRYNNILERVPEALARLEQLERGQQPHDDRGRFMSKEDSFELDGEEDEILTTKSARAFGQQLLQGVEQQIRAALQQESDRRTETERQRYVEEVMKARNLTPEHVPMAFKRLRDGRAKDLEDAADQIARMEQVADIDPYDFERLSPEQQKRLLQGVVPVLKKARSAQQGVKRETSPGESPGVGPEPKLEGDIMQPSNIEAVMKACEAIET